MTWENVVKATGAGEPLKYSRRQVLMWKEAAASNSRKGKGKGVVEEEEHEYNYNVSEHDE